MNKIELMRIEIDGPHKAMIENEHFHKALMEYVNSLWPDDMKFEKMWVLRNNNITKFITEILIYGEQNNCQMLAASEYHGNNSLGFPRVEIYYKAIQPSDDIERVAGEISKMIDSF